MVLCLADPYLLNTTTLVAFSPSREQIAYIPIYFVIVW